MDHGPIVVLLSADSPCEAELMEVGKEVGLKQGTIQTGYSKYKVTESFCSKSCWAVFTVNQRRTVCIHAVKLSGDPANGGRWLLLVSPPSSPQRWTVPCILSNSIAKALALPRIVLISRRLCCWCGLPSLAFPNLESKMLIRK